MWISDTHVFSVDDSFRSCRSYKWAACSQNTDFSRLKLRFGMTAAPLIGEPGLTSECIDAPVD
jgi:hypothetical protein